MKTSAKKKAEYDPARQWGLKPETQASGATYVVSGHVVSGGASQSMFIGEHVGREAQAKAARKLAADTDKTLQRLLSRDREGTKALVSAREFAKRKAEEAKEEEAKKGKGKGKGKVKAEPSKEGDISSKSERNEEVPRKNAYSAELIKQLGFDPTAKDGRTTKDANVQSKVRCSVCFRGGGYSMLSRRSMPLPLSRPNGRSKWVRSLGSLTPVSDGPMVRLPAWDHVLLQQCTTTSSMRTSLMIPYLSPTETAMTSWRRRRSRLSAARSG